MCCLVRRSRTAAVMLRTAFPWIALNFTLVSHIGRLRFRQRFFAGSFPCLLLSSLISYDMFVRRVDGIGQRHNDVRRR